LIVWDEWQFLLSGIGTPHFLEFDSIILCHYLQVNTLLFQGGFCP
jgi:hypothetical protein